MINPSENYPPGVLPGDEDVPETSVYEVLIRVEIERRIYVDAYDAEEAEELAVGKWHDIPEDERVAMFLESEPDADCI